MVMNSLFFIYCVDEAFCYALKCENRLNFRGILLALDKRKRLQKGYKMQDQKLIFVFLLSLLGCIIHVGCKDREAESEQISGLKIRELVKAFVSEGNNHQETNVEADTMPPVIPHPDNHHIEWSWSLFTPALRDLVVIGEPSVPYLLEEYMNKENKPFTIKSAGWAIIHIGDPALSYIEKAIQTSDEEGRPRLAIIISAIADKPKSQIRYNNSQTNRSEKINLRILYVGHPQSEREKEYVHFLRSHFKEVSTGDLKTFKEHQTEGYNVIIMDYDGRCFDAPYPTLNIEYTRPTVTIAGVGGLIGSRLNLKTGYL